MTNGGIRLVHGHTKSTLITYFSGMKIDPKYAFLHAFFLICPSCPFQNLSIWPKTHPFFQIARFCTPKRCTCVQCLVLKNNPNYVNFRTSLIPPLTFEWPPGDKCCRGLGHDVIKISNLHLTQSNFDNNPKFVNLNNNRLQKYVDSKHIGAQSWSPGL